MDVRKAHSDVRTLPGAPRSPLVQEIWAAGIERILKDEKITEVQRQIITEWIDYITPVYVKLDEILQHWETRPR